MYIFLVVCHYLGPKNETAFIWRSKIKLSWCMQVCTDMNSKFISSLMKIDSRAIPRLSEKQHIYWLKLVIHDIVCRISLDKWSWTLSAQAACFLSLKELRRLHSFGYSSNLYTTKHTNPAHPAHFSDGNLFQTFQTHYLFSHFSNSYKEWTNDPKAYALLGTDRRCPAGRSVLLPSKVAMRSCIAGTLVAAFSVCKEEDQLPEKQVQPTRVHVDTHMCMCLHT